MADKKKTKRVVVFFDQAHPFLMKHCSHLGQDLITAVANLKSLEHVREISLLVEGKNNFFQLKTFFTNFTQPASAAVGSGQSDMIQDEPCDQEISGRDGLSGFSGKPGEADFQTEEDEKLGKAQWNQSSLNVETDLRRYVIAYEIPDKYKQMSLETELFKPPFPVAPPRVIYPRKSNKALFICGTVEDAEKLVAYQGHKDFTFKFLHRQSLTKLQTCCRLELAKQIISQQDKLRKHLEGTEIEYDIGDKPDEIVFMASTTIQLQYVEETIRNIADTLKTSREKQIADTLKTSREKQMSTSEFLHVDTFSLSEVQWDILCIIESEILTELQKEESISFSNGNVAYSADKQAKSWLKFKTSGLCLQKQETEEVAIDSTSYLDAEKICGEIREILGLDGCIYVEKRKSVVVFSEKYEELLKIKHLLNVKLGKIQVKGRQGRRNLAAVEESITKTSENKEVVTNRREFKWDLHAENLRTFTTKEKITVNVYKASILNLPVECIVNAANSHLQHGGGVARVIADAAGKTLVQDGDHQINKKGKIPVGFAYTTTAGHLKYDCVIHAVGPSWYDYQPFTIEKVLECEDDLFNAVTNSFHEAEKRNLSSIALPAISSALFGVPEEICAYQYALATVKYSKRSAKASTGLKDIHFIDINYKIIKKIQDMFEKILEDDSSRPYDIQKYVKKSSDPTRGGNKTDDFSSSQNKDHHSDKNSSSGRRANRNFVHIENTEWNVSELKKSEDPHGCSFIFGVGQKLVICKGNLFKAKADALVTVVDQSGSGHGVIADKITEYCKHDTYKKEKRHKFTRQKQSGDVVVTCGFNNDFHRVFHIVYPYSEIHKSGHEKKKSLCEKYDNILKTAGNSVNSVSLVLLGTGKDIHDDIRLSAEAFADSYTVFCNRMKQSKQPKGLTVKLVCFEDAKYSKVLKILSDTFDRPKSQKNSPPLRPPPPEKTTVAPGAYPHAKASSEEKNSVDEDFGASKEPASNETLTEGETCVICMDIMDNPRELECGHKFCTDCIEQSLTFKQACPTCGKVCGVITGDQPKGTMTVGYDYSNLVGYESCGSIRIDYRFAAGQQEDHHPNPGKWYEGIRRSGFLPDNREGNIVLEMLRIAFKRKLVFTIGASRTTGQEGVITWNDIHHKTNPNPHGKFGYPDPTYLERVKDELSAKGITEKDIPEDKLKEINKRFKGHYK